jgi:type I restriction-modification system DNA methylase subunit
MFPNGKMDMYTAFIERCSRFLNKDGFQAMITQHGWLFQPTFEKLRKQFLNNMLLVNLLHLGPRAFDEINGEVVQTAAFVFSRSGVKSYKGTNMDLTKGSSEKQKEDEFFLRKRLNHFCYGIYLWLADTCDTVRKHLVMSA